LVRLPNSKSRLSKRGLILCFALTVGSVSVSSRSMLWRKVGGECGEVRLIDRFGEAGRVWTWPHL
jgi:hypothetical protein